MESNVGDRMEKVAYIIGCASNRYSSQAYQLRRDDLESELWTFYLEVCNDSMSLALVNRMIRNKSIDIWRSYKFRSSQIVELYDDDSSPSSQSSLASPSAIASILDLFEVGTKERNLMVGVLIQLNMEDMLPEDDKKNPIFLSGKIDDTVGSLSKAVADCSPGDRPYKRLKSAVVKVLERNGVTPRGRESKNPAFRY